MSPDLALRIQLLSEGQRSELQSVLARIETMNGLGDLDEGDLHALLDEIEKPLPPPTSVPIFELRNALTQTERRRIWSLVKPIAARCRTLAEFDVAGVPLADVPAWCMAKVEAERAAWAERNRARGGAYDPND